MELYNPMGQLVNREVTTNGLEGIYTFGMATAADAPTGNWQARVKVGGTSLYKKNLKIETVKPNRLKLDLDFEREKITALDKQISGKLNIRWLHGAKANNLNAQVEMFLSPATTTFKGYPNYSFDDQSKAFYTEPQLVFDGKVDAEGNATVKVPLNVGDNAPGALNALFYHKRF